MVFIENLPEVIFDKIKSYVIFTPKENQKLKAQVDFLREQLHYKTFGKPSYEEES